VAEPRSLEAAISKALLWPRVLAMLLATGLLVWACFVLGQALVWLSGWREPQWWAPAAGYAMLLVLFGQIVRHRGLLTPFVVLAAIGVLASLLLPFVRRSLRACWVDLLVLGAGLILLAAIPFFASGYAGILGASLSNDMSQHLTAAFWLRDESGMLPAAAIGGNLVNTGYPLGPHGMAAGLSRALGLGEVRAFSAVTLAIPALTGMIAFGVVPAARRGLRYVLAVVIGLGYLPAAYLAQGSFKEITLAMFALASAVTLGELGKGDERLGWRGAFPIAMYVAGSVYAYSYGGLLWLLSLTALYLAAEVLRRRELFSVVRRWAACGAGMVAVAALLILPELHRIRQFRNSIFGQESLQNKGNLVHALNPLETLGVWFSGDFRFNADPYWLTIAFCVLALCALAGSVVWWWRRGSPALPAAIVAAVIVWLQLTQTVNIYNAAKGLVVLAPLVMTCIGVPLVVAWSVRATSRWLWVARAVGVLLLAGALVSSFGQLRSTPVGLGSHDQEFAAIRPLVKGKPTLFLDNDHFGQWELRGAKPLYTSNALYAPAQLGQHPTKLGGLPIDVDNYGTGELDKLDYIVESAGAYRSQIPPNFKLALRTPSYDVYRRTAPTPVRQPFEPPGVPGAVLDCRSARGKQYLRLYRWGGVLPHPVVSSNWEGSIGRPGQTARMNVTLPPGRWDVSLQYVSRTPLTLRAPGMTTRLAQNYGLMTSFWPGGTITSSGRPLTLTLTADKRNWFGRLLGSPRAARPALSPGNRPLHLVAFTRHGTTPQRTPLRRACGRYLDWVAPAGSTMRGRF
jgi:hypothetical protein